MNEKKQTVYKSPDLSKMQPVVIDVRTIIYIALGADPEEAKSRYLSRIEAKNKVAIPTRKATTTTATTT